MSDVDKSVIRSLESAKAGLEKAFQVVSKKSDKARESYNALVAEVMELRAKIDQLNTTIRVLSGIPLETLDQDTDIVACIYYVTGSVETYGFSRQADRDRKYLEDNGWICLGEESSTGQVHWTNFEQGLAKGGPVSLYHALHLQRTKDAMESRDKKEV